MKNVAEEVTGVTEKIARQRHYGATSILLTTEEWDLVGLALKKSVLVEPPSGKTRKLEQSEREAFRWRIFERVLPAYCSRADGSLSDAIETAKAQADAAVEMRFGGDSDG